MIKHTPAPWHMEIRDGKPVIFDSRGLPLGMTTFGKADGHEVTAEESWGNGQVMTVAPELLGLLVEILPILEADLEVADCDQVRDELEDLIPRIQQVIAKAEGRA